MPIRYPETTKDRGLGFWLRPKNIWASRRFLRSDYSTEWRRAYRNPQAPLNRSVPFSALTGPDRSDSFSFVVLGDTGEGDRSQYALLPMIRHVDPAFIIINGDVTYPAGNVDDYLYGLFKPYRDLGIPIWAVPGNHDYYSKNQGREFFETFCTRSWAKRWAEYGLRLVPQPGTYWELRDPRSGRLPLVILGLDTGKKANLDGRGSQPADTEQLTWLQDRLRAAQEKDQSVMVLFHIPFLVDQEFKDEHGLYQLHHLLGRFSCVKMVVTAHQHNFQLYTPSTFRSFLDRVAPGTKSETSGAHYLVSGAGGASLGSVLFKNEDYRVDRVYPTTDQWERYAVVGRKAVDRAGLSKTLLGFIVGKINEAARLDSDMDGLVSFLWVKVALGRISVQPVFIDDVKLLYPNVETTVIDITDPNVQLDPTQVGQALRAPEIQIFP